MKTILLPVDLFHDTGWKEATAHAVGLAQNYGAELHVLTVIPDFGMPMVGAFFPANFSENALAEAQGLMDRFVSANIPQGIKTVQHVVHGTIYKEILAAAKSVKADMIVMASHRPEMRDYLLGPNAARVVRHAPMSVTVIR